MLRLTSSTVTPVWLLPAFLFATMLRLSRLKNPRGLLEANATTTSISSREYVVIMFPLLEIKESRQDGDSQIKTQPLPDCSGRDHVSLHWCTPGA